MKKIVLSILTLAILLSSCLLCFVGCDQEDNLPSKFEAMDYKDYKIANDLDSYEFFTELKERFANNTDYFREEYFSFDADAQIIHPTQENRYYVKREGNDIYSESITIGELMGDAHTASRYYFDGDADNLYSYVTESKKNVPGKPKDKDMFRVVQWGDYKTYKDGALTKEDRLKRFKSHITTYDMTKNEYMDANSDKKVYKKDDTLYFTLTIDCSDNIMKTIQKTARQEFLDSTGATDETFSMEKNTTLDFQAKMIDGEYRITYFRRLEFYGGKSSAFPVRVKCKQVCATTIHYGKDKGAITDAEKMNLA